MDKPPMYMKVWIYLLLRAQHTDYNDLIRGQLITSIPAIQAAMSYYIGFYKKIPTKKEIFGIIDWLRRTDTSNYSNHLPRCVRSPHESNWKGPMIVTQKVTHNMIVTICNYEYYQTIIYGEGNNEGDDEGLMKGTAGEQYKQECFDNDNNGKNENKTSCSDSDKAESKPRKISFTDDDYRLAILLSDLMTENNPDRDPTTEKQLKSWANVCRLMRELKGRSVEDIERLLRWSQSNSFWRKNILSMGKFREKYDRLTLEVISENIKPKKNLQLNNFGDNNPYPKPDVTG